MSKQNKNNPKIEVVFAPPGPKTQEPRAMAGGGGPVDFNSLNQVQVQEKPVTAQANVLAAPVATVEQANPVLPMTLSKGTTRKTGTTPLTAINGIEPIYKIGGDPKSVHKGTISNSRTTRTSY